MRENDSMECIEWGYEATGKMIVIKIRFSDLMGENYRRLRDEFFRPEFAT